MPQYDQFLCINKTAQMVDDVDVPNLQYVQLCRIDSNDVQVCANQRNSIPQPLRSELSGSYVVLICMTALYGRSAASMWSTGSC